jgi:hypothetical protein
VSGSLDESPNKGHLGGAISVLLEPRKMENEDPIECSGLSGRTIKTLNIFRATTNGTEIQIDFTDGTSFTCLINNRTEIDASLSLCGPGEPHVLERYPTN